MAFPLALAVLAAGGGALLLFGGKKKPATTPGGAPVLVPAEQLPAPPGAVAPGQMPGGPPTVIVSPPAGAGPALTPQQQVTQALPNLVAQAEQSFPQLFPGAAQPTPSTIKTVPGPGETKLPAGSAGPPEAPTYQPPVTAPAVIPNNLPQVLTNVLTQATQATSTAATPLQRAETQPTVDTFGTVALAKQLIDREASAKWKAALQPEIKAWQGRVGLLTDGKFGEKGVLRMAQEVGVLPLIRYWPANTLKGTEVPKFAQQLRAFATTVQGSNPAHAVALNNAAAFEVGFSYDANPAPIPVALRRGQADLLAQVLTK